MERTEPGHVESAWMRLWVAEKFQSNLEIAGSLRNSFRASLVESSILEVEHCLD